MMDKMEALTDDIGLNFATVNLDINDLQDFRIDLVIENL